MRPVYRWLVLIWRLPTGVSTPRVTAWRRLRRLGAVPLTPGAAIVAYSEELHEQMDWIAEDITDWGGDAWVLPVGTLPAADENRIRRLATRRKTAERGARRLAKPALARRGS
jgi:hypothetical protein